MSPRLVASLAVVATLLSACTGSTSATRTPSSAALDRRIVFFEDLSAPALRSAVLPAYEGLRLAVTSAEDRGALAATVEVESVDTKGDPATALDLARQYAADPTVVTVVASPFWKEPTDVADVFAAAGLATLSLSPVGAPSTGLASWKRMVATQDLQVRTLAAAIRRTTRASSGVCLVGDGTDYSSEVSAALAPLLRGTIALRTILAGGDDAAVAVFVTSVRSAGCGVLAWTGFGQEAAVVRQALSAAGLSNVVLVGTDAMQGNDYPSKAGPSGDGTIASCPCADLSTSTGFAQQRFVHDFQSENMNPPGPYSAEAYDAGSLLVHILQTERTRDQVRTAMATTSMYRGIANAYTFTPTGELAPQSAHVGLYRVEDGRWLPVDRFGA